LNNVYISSRDGQLANRLWQTSYIMANALEDKFLINHLFFGDYYHYFSERIDESKNNPIIYTFRKYGRIQAILETLIRRTLKLLYKLNISHLGGIKFLFAVDGNTFIDLSKWGLKKALKSKTIVLFGWYTVDRINLLKYKEEVINYWTPNKSYLDKVNFFNAKYRENAAVLIGIHIRRGDYKTFQDGKYFFDDSTYQNIILQISKLSILKGKSFAFCICSDDKNVNLEIAFPIYNESRQFVIDLYLLSKCDYIIGPPSTFSAWASFYGNKPLAVINNKDMIIREDDFKMFSI
jgi:hypothetical protein